jgi:putative endopeptidase
MKKIAFITISTFLFACSNNEPKTENETNFIDPVTSHIDSSIAPGENFFLFANNGWFKANPIPSSEKSNGIFRTIQDTINESIKKICEKSPFSGGGWVNEAKEHSWKYLPTHFY